MRWRLRWGYLLRRGRRVMRIWFLWVEGKSEKLFRSLRMVIPKLTVGAALDLGPMRVLLEIIPRMRYWRLLEWTLA